MRKRKPRIQFTPAERHDIVTRSRRWDRTLQEFADEVGVSVSTLARWRSEHGDNSGFVEIRSTTLDPAPTGSCNDDIWIEIVTTSGVFVRIGPVRQGWSSLLQDALRVCEGA